MFKTILLPTDGSPQSEKAIPAAIQFARLNQAKIIGICVIQPLPFPSMGDSGAVIDAGNFEHQMESLARRNVEKIAIAAREANISFEGIVTLSPSPYEEIVEAAKKFSCDIILMASHGHTGLKSLFLGSQTQKVLAHSNVPV